MTGVRRHPVEIALKADLLARQNQQTVGVRLLQLSIKSEYLEGFANGDGESRPRPTRHVDGHEDVVDVLVGPAVVRRLLPRVSGESFRSLGHVGHGASVPRDGGVGAVPRL